jgi:hypothetical protein
MRKAATETLLMATIAVACVFAPASILARSNATPTKSPREVVDLLWKRATEGDLLRADGWQRSSGFYLHPTPFPGNDKIRVVSNHWGVEYSSIEADKAVVTVAFTEEGQIDSKMRYSPASQSGTAGTGLIFHLVLAPTYSIMYAPDGKTVEKKTPSTKEWQISEPPGQPWATVNTALRYVLQVRHSTSNPEIKRNADETIAQLLKLD